MHAGEALWALYAMTADLERRSNSNPAVLAVAAQAYQACAVLSQHIGVPLPGPEQQVLLLAHLDGIKQAASAQHKVVTPDSIKDANGKFALELCDDILGVLSKIEEAQIFEAQAFVDSVREKTTSMRESVVSRQSASDKMVSSLHNMKTGAEKWLTNSDDKTPWE